MDLFVLSLELEVIVVDYKASSLAPIRLNSLFLAHVARPEGES